MSKHHRQATGDRPKKSQLERPAALRLTLGLLGLLGAFVCLSLLTKPKVPKPGWLTDANLRPLAQVPVRVRLGAIVKDEITDADGQFPISQQGIGMPTVDGYGLGYITSHTGWGPFRRYHFSPLGEYRFIIGDSAGKPVPNLSVKLATPFKGQFEATSDGTSGFLVKGVPLGIPDHLLHISFGNRGWRLKNWSRKAQAQQVTYRVVLDPLASPDPQLRWYGFINGKVTVDGW